MFILFGLLFFKRHKLFGIKLCRVDFLFPCNFIVLIQSFACERVSSDRTAVFSKNIILDVCAPSNFFVKRQTLRRAVVFKLSVINSNTSRLNCVIKSCGVILSQISCSRSGFRYRITISVSSALAARRFSRLCTFTRSVLPRNSSLLV